MRAAAATFAPQGQQTDPALIAIIQQLAAGQAATQASLAAVEKRLAEQEANDDDSDGGVIETLTEGEGAFNWRAALIRLVIDSGPTAVEAVKAWGGAQSAKAAEHEAMRAAHFATLAAQQKIMQGVAAAPVGAPVPKSSSAV